MMDRYGEPSRNVAYANTDRIKVTPLTGPLPSATFLLPSLNPMTPYKSNTPLYNTSLGANFDREWILGAKKLRRIEMTRPPADFELAPETVDLEWQEEVGLPLDLADWEKDIIMTPLRVSQLNSGVRADLCTTQESTTTSKAF